MDNQPVYDRSFIDGRHQLTNPELQQIILALETSQVLLLWTYPSFSNDSNRVYSALG